MKMGIQNLKEVVVALMKTFNTAVVAHKNDGKIDFNDVALFLALMPHYQVALQDVSLVVPEAKDLDPAEMSELVAAVIAELGGVEADVAVKVEKVLLALKANYEAVRAFV